MENANDVQSPARSACTWLNSLTFRPNGACLSHQPLNSLAHAATYMLWHADARPSPSLRRVHLQTSCCFYSASLSTLPHLLSPSITIAQSMQCASRYWAALLLWRMW